jgi:hypothetical protein
MTYRDYVPVLKWRQGEYQALFRLNAPQQARIVPLIEVTPPDFDFESWQPKKTIDEHLEKFAARLKQKWGSKVAFLDTGLLDPTMRMAGGLHPLTWLRNQVRSQNGTIVPVTGLERDASYQAAIRSADAIDGNSVALRCSLEEAADSDFDGNVESLLDRIAIEPGCLDMILDLKSPNFKPIEGLAQLLATVLSASVVFEQARSVTIVATSFPLSMAQVTGPIQFLQRDEWLLYKALIPLLSPGQRRPGFGDYGIATHELSQGDMRLLKPSATVRYTINDGCLIAKGKNVRDNGFEQYRGCCASVTSAAGYLGPTFSPGSEYIDQCRRGAAKTGNLSTWRWVGTNHHIAKVVYDLASFHGT